MCPSLLSKVEGFVFMLRFRSIALTGVLLLGASLLYAGDIRINLPKRSKPTPVQQLNRDGVKAVEHHDYVPRQEALL